MSQTGKSVKRNLTSNQGNSPEGWEAAILEGERLLRENKLRAAKLRAAIRRFKENLATGEPWPRDPTTQN